jgi:hypothetical protein
MNGGNWQLGRGSKTGRAADGLRERRRTAVERMEPLCYELTGLNLVVARELDVGGVAFTPHFL